MSEARNRRWFQFHLSAAIFTMLVAGGIIGINLHRFRVDDLFGCTVPNYPPSDSAYSHFYGFPFIGYYEAGKCETLRNIVIKGTPGRPAPITENSQGFHGAGVAGNVAVAVGALMLAMLLCEFLVRRQERVVGKP